MKNNDFNRKVKLKDVLDNASPDQIESFIEKNKNSGVSDEIVENIKAKVLEKTGIENKNSENDAFKPTDKKTRKMNFNRWGALAACVLLAVAVALGVKYINFGNNPPIVSGEASDDKSAEGENSLASGESAESASTESENTSTEDSFEIKGINWAKDSSGTEREDALNLVKDILWENDKTEYGWATVSLEKLTPLGAYDRENKTPLYISVAEIKIITLYNSDDISFPVKEGDTIQIFVDWIVENDMVYLSYYDELENNEKGIYCLPMTEIGEKYVLSFIEIENKEVLEILENNYPEVNINIGSFTSYPMFSTDFSEIKGLNEYKITSTWPFIYATAYEWYMKDSVSKDANENRLYEFFDCDLIVPENPMKKS